MPSIGEMFPSRFLKGSVDFATGEVYEVRVARVTQEEFEKDDGSKEGKWVCWFEGAKKGLVLNKTNAEAVSDIYGPNTDNWIGQPISLYGVMGWAFGKEQMQIRVRATSNGGGVVAPHANGNVTAPSPSLVPASADDPDGDDLPF